MSFWDSSALVPLVVREPRSEELQSLHSGDERFTVWWGTVVECVAAAARRRREGRIKPEAEVAARRGLDELAQSWIEMAPSLILRQ